MIKSITVTNFLGEKIVLELTRPEKSGLIVTAVEGLGPAKATINTTDISTGNGSSFNSSRITKRNIVINLCFMQNGSETIEDIRHKTYTYFPISRKVRITIVTDNRTLVTDGYIENNEPNIFTQNETCQISIICPDPFFYAPQNDITGFCNTKPMFYFPFSNNDVSLKKLKMGVIESRTEQVIFYDGNSEIGMTIYIHALGNAENITLLNVLTGDTMILDTSKISSTMGNSQGVIAGDSIIISTIRGNKSVTLLRNGIKTNILNCLKKGSKWLSLTKGDNILSYNAEMGASNLQLYIENQVAYDGV